MSAQNIALAAQKNNVSFNGGTVTANSKLSATAQGISVNSGKLTAQNAEFGAKQDLAFNGGSIAADNKAELVAGENILFNKGSLKAQNADMVAGGYIDEVYDNSEAEQADSSYALEVSDTLRVLTNGTNNADGNDYGIDLGSRYNKLHNVWLYSEKGNIILGNGGDDVLDVAVQTAALDKDTVDGNILIHNFKSGVANEINVSKSLKAKGSVELLNDEGDIIVGANGTPQAGGVVEGSEISFVAARNIENKNSLTAAKSVSLRAQGTIVNGGDIKAGAKAVLHTEGDDIINKGDINAANDITVDAAGNIVNVGNYKVTQQGDIKVVADKDIINNGNFVTAKGSIGMKAQEDLLNLGTMVALGGDVELASADGSIYNDDGADLISIGGNVTLRADSKDSSLYYYNADNRLVPVPENTQIHTHDSADKFGGRYVIIDGKEYDVVKNGSVFNAGDALALGGTITLASAHGDVTNYDDFGTLVGRDGVVATKYNGFDIATGNIVLSAANGRLYNSKDLEAGGDVTLTAAEGLTNFAYNVYAGKNITLTATQGDVVNSAILESYAGDVTLKAEQGNVINGVKDVGTGDIITFGGNVILSANGYGADGKAGSVTNYGDIIATNVNAAADKDAKGSITLVSEHGDVDNYDDFNTYQKDGKYIKVYDGTKHGSLNSESTSYNIANNNLTLSAKEGHVYNDKDYLVALGNVTLEAKSGLGSFGQTIYAGKNITLHATDGNLFNKAELWSVEGDITLKAEKGTVVNLEGGDIIAKNGNVLLEAGGAADNSVHYVDAAGNTDDLSKKLSEDQIKAVGENIIKSKQYYKAADGSWIEIVKTNDGEVVVPDTATEFKTEFVYIDAANKNAEVSLATVEGDRSTGLAEAYRMGDIVNRGDIVAQGDADKQKGAVTLHSQHGNVTNYDNFKLLNGKKDMDYLGASGDVRFNPGTEYFYDTKGILLSDSDMVLTADEGYLYNNMNIVSDRDVSLTSGKTLTIGTNVSSIVARGNIVARSLAGKIINDGHVESLEKNIVLDGYDGVTSEVGAANLKALNGSISVTSTLGEINVDELFAGETAFVKTAEKGGNIKLGSVGGKQVIIATDNDNSVIRGYDKNKTDPANPDADKAPMHVKVKDYLKLQGNYFGEFDIDRSGNAGTLVVDVNGVGGKPVQGDLELNIDGDVLFNKLNVRNAEVAIGGKLAIDKLHVGGRAHLTGLGFKTGVYGSGATPYHEDSNALYYDTSEGTDEGGWMNLYIDTPRDQRSNGLLLHIDTGYHSAPQRWSAEDLAAKLLDYKPSMSYNAHYGDVYGLFTRYNVIELSDEEEEQA